MKPGTISEASNVIGARAGRRLDDARLDRDDAIAVEEQAGAPKARDRAGRGPRPPAGSWAREHRGARRADRDGVGPESREDNAEPIGMRRRQPAVALREWRSSMISPTVGSMPPSTMHSGSRMVAMLATAIPTYRMVSRTTESETPSLARAARNM